MNLHHYNSIPESNNPTKKILTTNLTSIVKLLGRTNITTESTEKTEGARATEIAGVELHRRVKVIEEIIISICECQTLIHEPVPLQPSL